MAYQSCHVGSQAHTNFFNKTCLAQLTLGEKDWSLLGYGKFPRKSMLFFFDNVCRIFAQKARIKELHTQNM